MAKKKADMSARQERGETLDTKQFGCVYLDISIPTIYDYSTCRFVCTIPLTHIDDIIFVNYL